MDEVFREIQRSNMSKLGADGKPIYREDGKGDEGPEYFKPDIATILGQVTTVHAPNRSHRSILSSRSPHAPPITPFQSPHIVGFTRWWLNRALNWMIPFNDRMASA